jgi:hypothetical protein
LRKFGPYIQAWRHAQLNNPVRRYLNYFIPKRDADSNTIASHSIFRAAFAVAFLFPYLLAFPPLHGRPMKLPPLAAA